MDPSVRRFTPITVPWDLLIYMKMGMVWAEIFAGLFGFWFSCGVYILSALVLFCRISGIVFRGW
jgi:hypothetical protein